MWWLGIAQAGYGDAEDGVPSWAERETFLWTNLVRADPGAFEAQYACDFDGFSTSERSSQRLLRYNADLAAAASYHSHDMDAEGYFAHDSIDGTSWDQRISSFYSGWSSIAENIAFNYPTPRDAVFGWMCSDGHRANLMSPDFDELGTGVSGAYYTQDFGKRSPADRAMTMGHHQPEDPTDEVTLLVDWDDAPPARLVAWFDGVETPELALVGGSASRGLYAVTIPTDAGCHAYTFEATTASGTETWPEDGAYGFGPCAWSDPGARWLAEPPTSTNPPPEATTTTPPEPPDEPASGDDDDDDDLDEVSADSGTGAIAAACGCATGAEPGLAWLVLLVAPWMLRRRA